MLHLLFLACNTADQTFSATNTDIASEQGNAKIEWSPGEFIFSYLEPDITYSGVLTVTSVGDNTLTIDKVDLTNSAEGIFYMDTSATSDISLSPTVSREFVVLVTIPSDGDGLYQGEMRVKSNDEANRDLRIPMCTFPLGYEGEMTCGSTETTEDTAVDTGE